MTKLNELEAVIASLREMHGFSRIQAKKFIAQEVGCSLSTVEGWLSNGQTMPIPDLPLKYLQLVVGHKKASDLLD